MNRFVLDKKKNILYISFVDYKITPTATGWQSFAKLPDEIWKYINSVTKSIRNVASVLANSGNVNTISPNIRLVEINYSSGLLSVYFNNLSDISLYFCCAVTF